MFSYLAGLLIVWLNYTLFVFGDAKFEDTLLGMLLGGILIIGSLREKEQHSE